ncbi:ABC transporter ATP-binding protein [Streptomyces sp. NBC_00209]|uniref:ABC transporter ATP-binding protein n=1 Tax=Streptomyces sp. NBC_00209 TaxID=2975682 RepID=UPI00324F8112
MSIVFTNCTYRYGRRYRPVLDDFSYRVPDGVTIFLGPNGAGKSTALKLAASVIRPQTGRIGVDGVSSRSREYRKHVAWMPQHITPMTGMTAREQVAYSGWLKGMNRSDAWEQSHTALATVDLLDKADAKANSLSGGQLRRVGVASALVHECRVLLLDEPTAGMDPTQRRAFRDVLSAVAEGEGVKVLMSTHDVADLADDADYVTVLSGGTIRFNGATHEFLAQAPPDVQESRRAEGAYTALTAL